MPKVTDQSIPPALTAYWQETGTSSPDPDPAVRRVRSRPTARRARPDPQNRSTRARIIAALMRSPRLLAQYPATATRRVAALAALDELTTTPVWFDYWDVANPATHYAWYWPVTVVPAAHPRPYSFTSTIYPPYDATYGTATERPITTSNFAYYDTGIYHEDPPNTRTRTYRLPPRPAGAPQTLIVITGTAYTYAQTWRRGARLFDAWGHSAALRTASTADTPPTTPFVPAELLAAPTTYTGWTGHWHTTPIRGVNTWNDFTDHEADAHFYDLHESDPLLLAFKPPAALAASPEYSRFWLHVGPLPACGRRLNNNDFADWDADVSVRVLVPREATAPGPWAVNTQDAYRHANIHLPTGWLSPVVREPGEVSAYPAGSWYVAITADGAARTVDRSGRTITKIFPTPPERAALPAARKSPSGLIIQTPDEVTLRSSRWLTLAGGYGTPLSDALIAAADWIAGPTWDRHARLIGTTWYWYDGLTQLSPIPAPPGLAPRYQATPTTLWCETTYAGAQHLFSVPWDGTTWTDAGARTDTVWPIPTAADGALWHRTETAYRTYSWTRRAPDGTLTTTHPVYFALPIADGPTTW